MSAITVIRALRNINFLKPKPNYGIGASSKSYNWKSGKLFQFWGPLKTAIDGKDSKTEEKDNLIIKNPSPPSSTFEQVLDSDTFVDKSELILAVFEKGIKPGQKPMVLCTAPRRFGKTANLWMMQRFLEMEIDENGKEKTEKVNRNMFSSARLKVMENKEFVDTHFGKYPIININFACSDVKSKSDAVDVCREAISYAFMQHSYLYESTLSPLNNGQKKVCEKWCDESTYKTIPEKNVINGLANLARYLYKFHQKQVFLFVDEYDAIISNALCHLKNANPETELEELEEAVKFPLEIIGYALKNFKNIFKGAYITGILDVASPGFSPLFGDVLRVQFGAYHPFQDFLGFTEGEVLTLFNRFEVKEELRRKAEAKYNGYLNGSRERLYNPFSIVQFLENLSLGEGALQNYWLRSSSIDAIKPLFQADNVRNLLRELLKGEKHLKKIRIKPLSLSDLQSLHSTLTNGKTCEDELVYRFLISLGYLTYSSDDQKLQIPNGEVSDEFIELLQISFFKKHGLDEDLAETCSASFDKLTILCEDGDSSEFKKELATFQNSITCLLQGSTSTEPLNEARLQRIITTICDQAGFHNLNEKNITNKNTEGKNKTTRADVVLFDDKYGTIIELKYGENQSVENAFKQIFEKQYYNVFKKKIDKKDIRLSLVMGVHVDIEKKASVMCLWRKDIIAVLNDLKIDEALLLERIDKVFKREDFINNCCEKAKKYNNI